MDLTQLSEKMEKLEQRVSTLERILSDKMRKGEPMISTEKPQSVREFLLTKNAGSDVQKTLIMGYYLEHVMHQESFNVSNLERMFRAAKESVPKNLNDMINKNIGKGYLMEAKEKRDGKKAWVLTATGENFIQQDGRNKT